MLLAGYTNRRMRVTPTPSVQRALRGVPRLLVSALARARPRKISTLARSCCRPKNVVCPAQTEKGVYLGAERLNSSVFVLTVKKLRDNDVIAALPFKDEIKGRDFPDFSDDIELLAASEPRLQRNFHMGTGEGKIRATLTNTPSRASSHPSARSKISPRRSAAAPSRTRRADIVIDALRESARRSSRRRSPGLARHPLPGQG